MRRPATWCHQMAAGLACILLVASCSTETKQRLLHVFFTGVDETNAPPVNPITAPRTNTTAQAMATPAAPVVYLHQPFMERKCESCHLTNESEQLRANGAALCLECHEKVIENAKFVHTPIKEGKCLPCHEAHKSTERFLLSHKAQELCAGCHKLALMVQVKGHATMGDTECVNCHDAHRSDNKYLVKAHQ